ncbi:MAG: tetratricopeptide repeat protein [Verrucomicrobiota bacterium]|nr:tetratricopeptide repeat protein [Verrucomicrobiota bacterium]
MRNLSIMLAVCFGICGWHYIRIWRRFGTPVLGNWNVAAGFPWWQDPGYHTAADYFRFGRSLVAPLFSGFAGFLDGIYSTLWGDGLCGGTADLAYPPPWNYQLIVAGYLLSLAPALIILSGAVIAVGCFVRKPSADRFLLLGLCATVTLGLTFMTLKVASYAQIKAFYGLCMLVPLSSFGAMGWEVLTRGRRLLQLAVGTVLLVWAINSFTSVWIRDSVPQHLAIALKLRRENQIDASVSEVMKAVSVDPSNSTARRFLASVLDEFGRPSEALQEAERAVELSPTNSACHVQLSSVLARQGQMERAIHEARHAIDLGPENSSAYDVLLACLLQTQRNKEALSIARDGLAVSPFNAELHYALAFAATREMDLVTASTHFGYALLFRPNWDEARSRLRLVFNSLEQGIDGLKDLQKVASLVPDSPIVLNDLAWLFATHPDATLRDGHEAVRLAEHACIITSRRMPGLLGTLAAAYAEAGRFSDAITVAEEALSLARSSGDADVATRSRNLLDSFRANRPYREQPVTNKN